MDMDAACDMDAEGNCVIDSATCAEWMAAGKFDSSDCIKMENGKCHIKSDACEKITGADCCKNKKENCESDCMKKCKEQGIECGNGKPCPMHNKSEANHNCANGCDAACMKMCEDKGMACKGKKEDCCH